MKRLFNLAIVFSFLMCMSVFAYAQDTTPPSGDAPMKRGKMGKGDGMRGKHGGHMMGMLKKLNLTDTQKQQIRDIMQSGKGENSAESQEMRQLMQGMREGTLTDEQKARLQELRKQTMVQRKEQMQQIMAVLTPEQKEQLKQMQQEQKENKQRRKRGGGQPTPETPVSPPNN